MVRSVMRYGAGGPHRSSPRVGPRGASGGAIQSQFRMDWDEHEVVQALNRMGVDGPQIIRNVLAGRIESAIEETKEALKKMAGPLEMVEVYPWDRFGFSDNIYVKVANALKYDEVPGQEHFRVHMGSHFTKAHEGVIGSRGGRLSDIVVGGMKPFRYPHYLPDMVRSSTGFFKKTGQPGFNTVAMMKRATHPGFSRTYDVMLNIENHVVKHFPEDVKKTFHLFKSVVKDGYGRYALV